MEFQIRERRVTDGTVPRKSPIHGRSRLLRGCREDCFHGHFQLQRIEGKLLERFQLRRAREGFQRQLRERRLGLLGREGREGRTGGVG